MLVYAELRLSSASANSCGPFATIQLQSAVDGTPSGDTLARTTIVPPRNTPCMAVRSADSADRLRCALLILAPSSADESRHPQYARVRTRRAVESWTALMKKKGGRSDLPFCNAPLGVVRTLSTWLSNRRPESDPGRTIPN